MRSGHYRRRTIKRALNRSFGRSRTSETETDEKDRSRYMSSVTDSRISSHRSESRPVQLFFFDFSRV